MLLRTNMGAGHGGASGRFMDCLSGRGAVCSAPRMTQIPGFTGYIEFTVSFSPRPGISHVLFDFDGTLSLIREGWPEVMVPMFVEMLPPLAGESDAARRQLCAVALRAQGQENRARLGHIQDRRPGERRRS